MESLARLQGLVRGHLVRQALSQVRTEYEQISDAIESPFTRIIWPDAAILGKPCFTTGGQSSRERSHSIDTVHQRCEIPAQPAVDVQYPTIEKQPDSSRADLIKTVVPHDESTVEGATVTFLCREKAADEQDRDDEPLHSSSPHSNDRPAKEHLSQSFAERQMLLSSSGVDNSSTIHVDDPMETAQVLQSHPRADHLLSLCKDDTVFAGGSESESISDHAYNDRQGVRPKPMFREENTDIESWLNCLPSEKGALRAMHGDLLMELLWIEQAISSRVEYLAIKAKMGGQKT